MAWRFELATEVGGRAEQQDRAEVLATPDGQSGHLVVLADGMGGRRHGAVAAQAVVDAAKREFTAAPITDPKRFLTDLCRKTHKEIGRIGRRLGSSPASTCALLYVKDSEAYWAHVGDSRLYHFDGDELLFRTRDHTVAELLKNGGLTGAAARAAAPVSQRLYMSLGGKNRLEAEFGATAIGRNDWFMLCSDGFWSQVKAEEVAQSLTARPWERKSAADFVALAADRGGVAGDNVALALAIHDSSRLQALWRRLLPTGRRFGR